MGGTGYEDRQEESLQDHLVDATAAPGRRRGGRALVADPANLDRLRAALDDLEATVERIAFWLRELRTPEFLVEAAGAHAEALESAARQRPLLKSATRKGLEDGTLARALRAEEDAERSADAEYWRPLREKLSRLRREARRSVKG